MPAGNSSTVNDTILKKKKEIHDVPEKSSMTAAAFSALRP